MKTEGDLNPAGWPITEEELANLVVLYDRLDPLRKREFWQLTKRQDKLVYLLRWGSFAVYVHREMLA